MMKIIFFSLFLTPLLTNWWLVSSMLSLFMIYLLSFSLKSFYINISYGYGMDNISYWLIVLSFWIVFLMIFASYKIKMTNNFKNEFIFMNLFLLIMLVLSFSTSNLLYYYIFFESTIIPTLFLIFGWGYQPERLSAGFYFLFYTLFASLPLFLGIIYIYNFSNCLFMFMITIDSSFYLYLCMILAFLFKMPMLFFHFWLPKAHVEAPISGSMILAGVLLKLGGYGFYRVYTFLNDFSVFYNYIPLVISMFGTFIVGFLCLCQFDIKTLIAYSSVAHMGLVIGGIMTLNVWGLYGSFVLMLGHGLCSSGLFCLANIVYERTYSRSLLINKGLVTCMPVGALFWFIFSANNMSSPISLNFVGEIFLVNSIMSYNYFLFFYLAFSAFLSCCYSIYLFSITQHGSLFSLLNINMTFSIREYLLLLFHLVPLNLLFLGLDLFMY
uniref:NADH-ubiquinone oxidoreductase chain 4 n=1 Tax=Stenophyella macreta TaxID=2813424 RepID=A0A8T9ZWH4_9HEMI|nr:NADH dehydrogenase subunit 4 [Stenophyella macreta]